MKPKTMIRKFLVMTLLVMFIGASDVIAQNRRISRARANQIALQRVKGTVIGTRLETDDGRQKYEVTIRNRRGLYEVEINARTGAVIDVERKDDDSRGRTRRRDRDDNDDNR